MLIMIYRSIVSALALGLMALMPVQCAFSQAGRGSISGEIHDPSGALIPNVPMKLIEVHTNQEYEGKTDDKGVYAILNLVPGSYSLIVEADGFKKFTQEGIELATGEKLRVDARDRKSVV
jgi:hypothetical protein